MTVDISDMIADLESRAGKARREPAAAPSSGPTFNALAEIADWSTAHRIHQAIRAGSIPNVEYKPDALHVLNDLADRMAASIEQARARHAAWNPMECITHVRLEIETGKYHG